MPSLPQPENLDGRREMGKYIARINTVVEDVEMSTLNYHPAAPSVFISSTVHDLRDLRSALAFVLRSQGIRPFASEAAEFELQGDRSAVEECYARVRSSDYYVLIIGGRRGYTEEDGLSVTRHEYRIARNQLLATGKPKIWIFIRKEIERALAGTPEAQAQARIEDPEHLKSFVDEVRAPDDPTVPNWVSGFDESSEVIESVLANLNLGRNLWESFVRYALVSELTTNLALMTERFRTTAVPPHRYMTGVRSTYTDMGPEDLSGDVAISEKERGSLALALLPALHGGSFGADAIKQAVIGGVFLSFDLTTAAPVETPMHKALNQLLADIEALRQSESSYGDSLRSLVLDLTPPPRGGVTFLIKKHDLIMALSHHDRMENLFKGHVAICDALISGVSDPTPFTRTPLTPIGDKESNQIRAETVSPTEVRHLVTNHIFPFGDRIMPDFFGKTEEEQIQSTKRSMVELTARLGLDIEVPDEILEEAARNFLRDHSPAPDEGIQDLSNG